MAWKHEDLSSVPQTHVKKLGIVACPYDPSMGEAETGGSLGLLASQLMLLCEPLAHGRSFLRNNAVVCGDSSVPSVLAPQA